MLVNYLSREQIMNELQQSFELYLNKYGIENIGIFEEEGQDDRYYLDRLLEEMVKSIIFICLFKKIVMVG